MEGRHPPPRAEHPFPNNPDMTKFWGNQSRAMFRSFAVVMGCYFTLAGINMYLTRHEKGPFGMDITLSESELKKKKEILNSTGILRYPDLDVAVSYKMREKHMSLSGTDMKFDDDIQFNIPYEKNVPPTKTTH